MTRGLVNLVPACNVSYKRSALDRIGATRGGPFWTNSINHKLAPGAMWLEPSLLVRFRRLLALHDYLRSRYDHGRCYAAMRVNESPLVTRGLRALSAPLLPLLLGWRLVRNHRRKRLPLGPILATLPALFAIHSSWALGELAGYLSGARKSCARLYD